MHCFRPIGCKAHQHASHRVGSWTHRSLLSLRNRGGDQWEKVAVLRVGRYVGLRGPLFLIIPIVETLSRYVDQRVRVPAVGGIDAHARYRTGERGRNCLLDSVECGEIHSRSRGLYPGDHVERADGLRESIGRHELAQMITERETLGRELQRILDEKTKPWGITVQSVEIRDVQIPQALEDAMSRRRRPSANARLESFWGRQRQRSPTNSRRLRRHTQENPVALHLRAMNMLYEAIKEKGSMVIVPSSAVETMGLGGTLATASIAKQ